MTYWQAVEDVTTELPLGHELIHQRHEAGVVGWLQQVDHLMDHDVFEALAGFLGEVGVEADGAGVRVATAPLGFHALHEDATHLHAHQRFPFGDQRRRGCLELLPIPGF